MTKRICILYIDNTFTFGGAINSLLYLLRGLDKDKYEPVIITGQASEFMQEYFNSFTWYHVSLTLSWVHNKWYNRISIFPLFRVSLFHFALKLARKIYWILFVIIPEAFRYYWIGKRHGVDLVHLNNILGSQLAGVLAAKLLRVPCVAHLRDFEVVHPITTGIAGLIDKHVAISSAIRANLLALSVPEERISVIYDAIDLDTFHEDTETAYLKEEFDVHDSPCFGIFGRVIEWKGIREFVGAASLVCKKMPAAKVFIVGDFSDGDQGYVDEVKELVYAEGLGENVIFTGYRNDVPALMKFMDIIVHASIEPEPFGMVLIEAMAMGKAIVATKAGGPLDIVVDGCTGFLVEPANEEEMAEKILKIFEDMSLAGRMGEKGRARAIELFSKERYASQVEGLYTEVLQ